MLAEFSTSTAENSASTADFRALGAAFPSNEPAEWVREAKLRAGTAAIKNNQYLCFAMADAFRSHAFTAMNSQEEFVCLLTQHAAPTGGSTAQPKQLHRKASGEWISAFLLRRQRPTCFSSPDSLFSVREAASCQHMAFIFRNHSNGSVSRPHNSTNDARIRTHCQDFSRS